MPPRRAPAASGRRRRVGRVRVRRIFRRSTRARRRPWRRSSARCRERSHAIRSRSCGSARPIAYEVEANWKVMLENYNECYHCARRASRAVPARARRSSSAAASELDWERGIPHRDGAWTFTASGTSDRAPFPGLNDDERVRHKGELIYPNFMLSLAAEHVAAFYAVAAAAPSRPRSSASSSSIRTRWRSRTSIRRDAVDVLGPREPAGLGDLRERAARHALARVSSPATTRRWRAASLDIRRYVGERLESELHDDERDYEYIVLGLGGLGSGAAYWLSRSAARACSASSSSSWGTCAASRRTIRASSGCRTTRPTYVELAKHAYAAWDELEREPASSSCSRPAASTSPRATARSRSRTTPTAWRVRRAVRAPRRGRDRAALAAVRGRRRHPRAVPGGERHRDGGARATRRTAGWRARTARRCIDHAPVDARRATGGEIEVERRRRAPIAAGGWSIAAGAWSNGALAHFGVQLPLGVTQEQVTYFAPPRPRRLRAGPVSRSGSGWTIPRFYGFPVFGEAGPKAAQDAGGKPVDGRHARTSSRTRAPRARRGVLWSATSPARSGPIIYTKTCLYTLTPDRDFVIDTVPGHPNVVVAIGGGPRLQVRVADRADPEPSSRSTGATASDIAPFRIDRPILTMADPPKTYML